MNVIPATSLLRSDLFETRDRVTTTDVCVAYTDTTADPRIDAAYLDYTDAKRRYLGLTFHYIIKVDGSVEIGRNPSAISSRLPRQDQPTAILIGVVGGRDAAGKRITTVTDAQRDSVEALLQALADALQVSLGVTDYVADKQERDALIQQEEADEALEEILDLAESA